MLCLVLMMTAVFTLFLTLTDALVRCIMFRWEGPFLLDDRGCGRVLGPKGYLA